VYIQDLDDRGAPKGEPTRATNRESSIGGITWDRDGDSIIYVESIITGRVPYLWRAWANRAERLEVAGSKALYPSVSAQGSRLAFSRLHSNQDIWRYRPGVGQEPLITSTLEDRNPQLSPDGKRIAFESLQSGEAVEIWVSNLDGSNQVQLTNRLGRQQGTPRWSPDGRWIAFDSLGADGRVDVWVVDAGGGQPRRITSFPTDEACPSWSRDGNWIYFRSDRSGRREIWRAKVAGGAAEQVTRNGGFIAFESTDGKTLFYTKAQDSPIFATPVNGGPERQIVDYSVLRALAVVDEGIYYIGRRGEDGRNPLQLYEFSAGKSREIVRLDRVTQYGITVTPDRKTFLFSREMSSGADLMLVENFR
jgi:Tol biopolymer transport system component